MKIQDISINEILPYEKNAKLHPIEQIHHIANSIKRFGWRQPIVLDADNIVVVGHGRLLAAKELGFDTVPVTYADDLSEEEIKALRLADNKTNESDWDFGIMDSELSDIIEIDMSDFGFRSVGVSESELQAQKEAEAHEKLAELFLVPPMSILDARQGYWQDRKKTWKSIIRDTGAARGGGQKLFETRNRFAKKVGCKTLPETSSILDPVLCEVLLSWFLPHKGERPKCFDCFAGDTVFGFVSSYLGCDFTGIELREEQARFNQNRVDENNLSAKYICDDGRNVANHIDEKSQDLFFSCPPYFNMEKYSDMEEDASNQETYEEFYEILDDAFSNSCKLLKENRFAVVVCQDVRANDGMYYGFPEDIINTFERNGMKLYNRIILVRQIGSASLFAKTPMQSTRKVRTVHEDVLVFFNGEQGDLLYETDEDDVVDEFYREFLKARQSVNAHDTVLVFYNGDERKIKSEFGDVPKGAQK